MLGPLWLSLLLWAGSPATSPVADAAMRGDSDEVRALLRTGADVNAAQGDGMTALHWSAEHDDAEMARMVVQAGGNVDAVTRLGDYTPLHLAAKAASTSVVRVLLDAGASPHRVTSTGGATPLHFAAQAGDMQALAALVDHGAEVDARESMWLQTPLMFAAASGRGPSGARRRPGDHRPRDGHGPAGTGGSERSEPPGADRRAYHCRAGGSGDGSRASGS